MIIGAEVEEESESTESTPLRKLKKKVEKKKLETELSVEKSHKSDGKLTFMVTIETDKGTF